MFILMSLLLQKGYEDAAYCCATIGASLSSLTLFPAVFQEDSLLQKTVEWLRYEAEKSKERG